MVLLGIALAFAVAVIEDVWFFLVERQGDAIAVGYAALTTATYLLGVVLGLTGQRRAFFWNGLAIASLHIAFSAWYAAWIAKFMLEARTFFWLSDGSMAWNAGIFMLALALAYYLLTKERPRLFASASPARSSTPPELDDWIAQLCDDDPMAYEDAYFRPRPSGANVVPRLIQELRASSDSYTRGKFVELLGEMGDQTVVPVLIAELAHPDSNVREWAITALTELGAPDGIRAVKEYRDANPDD